MYSTRSQHVPTAGVLTLLLLLSAPGLAFAQSEADPATPPDLGLPKDFAPALAADSDDAPSAQTPVDPNAIDSLMDELTATSEVIKDQPGAEGPTDFSGLPQDSTNWVQALRVTRDDNPLLEKQCKEQAMHMTVNSLAALDGAENMEEAQKLVADHLRQHLETLKDGSIGHADYLREIAECKEFCAPLVAQLMQCHILSVARLEHGIVLFELGSDVVTPAYRSGLIDSVSKQLREHAERKVVLIGRASQIGDLRHNRALSARRALAAKDALLAAGIAAERIETMWFGWEPPQISDVIASEYGVSRLYDTVGRDKINQSVVVVIY
jgi:outer membrane protein OmpA-like peptidoglycan-associated protein